MRSLFETEDEPRDLKEITVTITIDVPSCESGEEHDDDGIVDFEDEGNQNLEDPDEFDNGDDNDAGDGD
jgi:hypothetical protein